jgi:hypothetical protein
MLPDGRPLVVHRRRLGHVTVFAPCGDCGRFLEVALPAKLAREIGTFLLELLEAQQEAA